MMAARQKSEIMDAATLAVQNRGVDPRGPIQSKSSNPMATPRISYSIDSTHDDYRGAQLIFNNV